MRILIFILFVCALASCETDNEEDYEGVKYYDDFAIIDSIVQEPECSTQGGMCVIVSDCPEPTNQTGLCPNQQHKSVECCRGLSKKETRCQKAGGVCVSMDSLCHEKLIFKKATDCYKQKCCIMVE